MTRTATSTFVRTTIDGGQEVIWDGAGKNGHPLIISPNLDALLEYDEKVRGVWTAPYASSAAPSPTGEVSGHTGLPPPPRRNSRVTVKPTLVKIGSPLMQEVETSGSTGSGWAVIGSAAAGLGSADENPYINPGPQVVDNDRARDRSRSPEWAGDGDGLGGNSNSGVASLAGGFGGGNRLLGIAPKASISSGLDSDTKRPHKAARARGKLLRLKDIKPKPADSEMSDGPRALLSHGSWSRRSSVSSSSSSHGPASTADGHRVSISSTIYQASSDSHPHHMYDAPESFVDIVSPTTNEPELTAELKPSAPAPVITGRHSPLPTTRSDLVRKNRKLARVFGQPPHPDAFLESTRSKPPVLPPIGRHNRGALSVSGKLPDLEPEPDWLPALRYMNLHSRRHSAPLTNDHDDSVHAALQISSAPRPSSPTSFIDLSDDPATPKNKSSRRSFSPDAQSLFENMSPEEQAEDIRRRKREKLAKVHRFLGSRVPTSLVLGFNDSEPALPPIDKAMSPVPETEDAKHKAWLRRRRSSSAAAYSSAWSDEVDRIKEDLDLKEKAINVRRAHKMEKVFGVAPPQTLYHTHYAPTPSIGATGHKMISGWTSPTEPSASSRNAHRSFSKHKHTHSSSKHKSKDGRPGTSESNKALLPKGPPSDSHPDYGARATDHTLRKRTSAVYSHYEESLNSLNDIIDRDDKESLASLHVYLSGGDMSVPPPAPAHSQQLQSFTRTPTDSDAPGPAAERPPSTASSIKSERRRSLPARTSLLSLSSLASDASLDASAPASGTGTVARPAADFQMRRRRAAKLTQFFGVDYTELIKDVLESIESGLEHERRRGTLDPEEVEDLLARLRNLRTKRGESF